MNTGLRLLSVCVFAASWSLAAQAASPAAGPSSQASAEGPVQWVAAQKAALAKLAYLDGEWRGTGWMIDAPGETPRHMTMTYRVGPFLDGTIRIIDIRGYLADGSYGFHAMNFISFDAQKKQYVMNARAAGRSGLFSFQVTGAQTYAWQIGSPTAGLHYESVIDNGEWIQIGRRIAPDAESLTMSDYRLRRVGPTDWPEAGALGPK